MQKFVAQGIAQPVSHRLCDSHSHSHSHCPHPASLCRGRAGQGTARMRERHFNVQSAATVQHQEQSTPTFCAAPRDWETGRLKDSKTLLRDLLYCIIVRTLFYLLRRTPWHCDLAVLRNQLKSYKNTRFIYCCVSFRVCAACILYVKKRNVFQHFCASSIAPNCQNGKSVFALPKRIWIRVGDWSRYRHASTQF